MTAQTYRTGTAINVSLSAGTGGTGELDYDLTPSLPDGLHYTAPADATTGGVISGTPTAGAPRATYTLTATDGDDAAAALAFSLAVQHYRKDAAVDVALPAASGGNGTLTYALSPGLPAGLTYTAPTDATTGGRISGMPTQVAVNAEYALTVTDADGDEAILTFHLSVAGAISFCGVRL